MRRDAAPLPACLALPGGGNGNHTFFHATVEQGRHHGHTVRELIRSLAGGTGHRVIIGTPGQIQPPLAQRELPVCCGGTAIALSGAVMAAPRNGKS